MTKIIKQTPTARIVDEPTINILVINEISVEPDVRFQSNGLYDYGVTYSSTLKATIETRRKKDDRVIKTIDIVSKSSLLHSEKSAIKEAVQNFMKGRFNVLINIHSYSETDFEFTNTVDGMEVNLPEPFRSLFYELFDVNNRTITVKQITKDA